MQKTKKRILYISLALFIFVSSICSSYTTANAMGAMVGISSEMIFEGLLGLFGVKYDYETEAEIHAAAYSGLAEFIAWATTKELVKPFQIDATLEEARTGYLDLQNENNKTVWETFAEWVAEKFYSAKQGIVVQDNRPDISTWGITDKLQTFLSFYQDDEAFPYYLVDDRTLEWETSTDIITTRAVVFDYVPLLYRDNEADLNYIRVNKGSVDYPVTRHTYSFKNYKSASKREESYTTSVINSEGNIGNRYTDERIEALQINVPIFDSKESALAWWNENVIDGHMIKAPTDTNHVIIDSPVSDLYDKQGSLDGYTAIGSGSYVNEKDQVIAKPVTIPIDAVRDPSATWDDVIAENIPIVIPQEGTLDDAIDLKDAVDEDEEALPIAPTLPNNATIGAMFADLSSVFPFCLPFDLIKIVECFDSEPEAPNGKITFDFSGKGSEKTLVYTTGNEELEEEIDKVLRIPIDIDYSYTMDIDLSPFNQVAQIFRVMQAITFMFGLILVTRNLIRG